MKWAKEFYRTQNVLTGVYTDTRFWSPEKIRAMALLLGAGKQDILELGAGGGQNARELARLGHRVTAVELVPELAEHARGLAGEIAGGTLTVITGDFYEVTLPGQFDAVCYWDGFGIGADSDQRTLLKKIAGWLRPGGKALIDVYCPWHAAWSAGTEHEVEGAGRRYGFDAEGSRWTDSWWPAGQEEEAVTQSLRCYSPADLRLLLEGTGLKLERIVPGGGFDRKTKAYLFPAPLEWAISYTALLAGAEQR